MLLGRYFLNKRNVKKLTFVGHYCLGEKFVIERRYIVYMYINVKSLFIEMLVPEKTRMCSWLRQGMLNITFPVSLI